MADEPVKVIKAGWLSEADAGYVGAANLLGYLVGAVLAGRAGQWLGPGRVIRVSALLVAVGFAASAWPGRMGERQSIERLS